MTIVENEMVDYLCFKFFTIKSFDWIIDYKKSNFLKDSIFRLHLVSLGKRALSLINSIDNVSMYPNGYQGTSFDPLFDGDKLYQRLNFAHTHPHLSLDLHTTQTHLLDILFIPA